MLAAGMRGGETIEQRWTRGSTVVETAPPVERNKCVVAGLQQSAAEALQWAMETMEAAEARPPHLQAAAEAVAEAGAGVAAGLQAAAVAADRPRPQVAERLLA
jgi:hypothetical protein